MRWVGGRDRGQSALLRHYIHRTRVEFETRLGRVRGAGGPWLRDGEIPMDKRAEEQVVAEEVVVVRFHSPWNTGWKMLNTINRENKEDLRCCRSLERV